MEPPGSADKANPKEYMLKSRGSPEIAVAGKPVEARRPDQRGTPTDGRMGKTRVLALSTIGFTLAFAVWMMFGVLGVPIRKELGLSDVELGWLLAASVLSGSLLRLPFGVLTDLYGGRVVFSSLLLVVAVPTFLVST
ncbi:MAG: MFS transporter, partial [Chloroflexota bacterium]